MNKLIKVAAVLGVASSLVGCSRDFSIEFEPLSNPQGATEISFDFGRIQLEDGFAVAIVARPQDNSEKMEWTTQVELLPSFNGVFDIERLEWDEEAQETRDYNQRDGDWNFLIWGISPGAGNIEVLIDGEFETDITVSVAAQPAGN